MASMPWVQLLYIEITGGHSMNVDPNYTEPSKKTIYDVAHVKCQTLTLCACYVLSPDHQLQLRLPYETALCYDLSMAVRRSLD